MILGLYYDAQEILPFVIGDHRFNKANEKLSRFASKEVEVRALIEGQSIAKRAHAEEAGFVISTLVPCDNLMAILTFLNVQYPPFIFQNQLPEFW